MASSKESVQNGVSKSHFIVYLSMFEHEKHADAQFHMNTCGDLKKGRCINDCVIRIYEKNG